MSEPLFFNTTFVSREESMNSENLQKLDPVDMVFALQQVSSLLEQGDFERADETLEALDTPTR
ncbi:MAG: hypothetical protein ACI87E_000413 [Mariniblastus sp.]